MDHLAQLAKEIKLNHLSKQICLYNGQKATSKQINKTLKSFCFSIELMEQFKKDRF